MGNVRRAGLVCALVAGCASTGPAPVDYRGQHAVEGPARPGRPLAAAAAPPAVQTPPRAPEGSEAPTGWAEGQGPPLSAWALQRSEAQPYDPSRPDVSHRVEPNETLYMIAARRQIPLRALIDANRLEPPFTLAAGQVLTLPPPRFHDVAPGETLLAVAQRYNVDARSLGLLNRLAEPFAVRPGDRLVLPALARAVSMPLPSPPALAPAGSRPRGVAGASLPPSGAAGNAPLAWPLRGAVVSRFGPQAGGARSDGVEIEAEPGAVITAAADGEVVYAGGDLPAYGLLVLVSHPDGLVTAYGYAGRLLRRAGDRVRRGDALAEAGANRVLFQVRRGAEPTDPLNFLPPA